MTSENLRVDVTSLHARRTRRLLAGASNAALAACLINWTAGARRVAPTVLALLTLVGAKAAVAQQTSSDLPPIVDYGAGTASAAYNVNGQLAFTTTDLSIGPADAGGLVFQQNYIGQGRGWRSNFSGTITDDTYGNFTVSFGPHSESFTYSSVTHTYTPVQASGSSIVSTSTGWNYTTGDGTVYTYNSSYWTSKPINPLVNTSDAQLVQITTPAGDVTKMTYSAQSGSNTKGNYQAVRLQSVVNNHGYMLAFQYSTASFNVLQTVTGINLAIDYCAPTANGCSGFTVTWPKVTYSTDGSGNSLVTDALGNTTTYGFDTVNPYGINAIKLPGSTSNNYSFTYFNYGGAGGPRQISTMVDIDGTYTNTYSTDGSGNSVLTQTDPLGHTHSKYVDVYQVEVKSVDGTGATSTRTDNYTGQILSSSTPEGVVTSYIYDSRGNVKSTTITPKSGSGLSPIITSSTFPATCIYVATCNKPSATFDALGNETDYTYDNTYGVTLSVTQPAPTAGAARPQVNSSYTNIYAAYKQSSGGGVTAAPSPIYELTQTNLCNTGASCSGASNQTVTTFAFATNNLAPTSTTTAAGNGSVSAVTQSAYDSIGNVISTTDPLGNVTVYRYDADRRKIGFVGPPPGVSGLSNRATKSTYNSLGEVTLVQQGTDTQSDTTWSSFSVLSQSSTAYDSLGRKIQDSQLGASGSVISTTQYNYDAAGRLHCSAVRMNPSTFSSLPAACTAATSGSYGADRISLNSYDNANRLTQTIVAYGTSANAAIVNNTYGADGELTTQSDAKGNLTTYVIDGFDRVSQIRFPTPSNGSVSSTTDYEQSSYDANGSITQDRRRDGSTITNTYDALKRLSQVVGGSINRTFTYDNVGRMTNAVDNTTGLQVALGYDALGRKLTDNQAGTTVTSAFDAAGRRTSLTFPDGYQVTYGFDATDDLTSINDTSGAFVTYTYDNLGRQTGVGRNLGPTTSYGYGSDLRLASIGHVFADSGKNLKLGYTYNPANQQTAATSSNSLYWGSSPPGGAGYGVDGQNKYTTVGSASFSYDARANLQSEGSASRTYDIANELTQSGSATLAYDATGRLYRTVGSSTTTFLYDGDQIVAEYDGSGNLQRRYVPGPGLDRPLVWLQGTSIAASNRRWLLTDNGASVVAVGTTGSGNTTYAINTYDAYGNGGAGNAGRFQYKGMAWIQEASIYHARARAYDPVIGRFMQTDPIGYQDGMNWYSFAHNSPLDGSDPTGKCTGSLISNADDTCAGGSSYIQGSGYSTKTPNRTLDQQKADYRAEMNDPTHKLMDNIGSAIAGLFTVMLGGPEIEMMTAAAPTGVSGLNVISGTFERTFATQGGNVQMLAEAQTTGTTLTLKDVAIYGQDGTVKAGASAVKAGLNSIAAGARAAGYTTLVVQGLRYSGAVAGTVQTITIKLTGH